MNLFRILYMKKTGDILPDTSLPEILFSRANGAITKTIDWTPTITINDAIAGAVIDYQTKITATQSGSGDPAPDNIRPISGFTGATISVNGSTVSVSWLSDAGTVYGGVLDVTTGTLTVTHIIVDLSLLEWETRWEGEEKKTIRAELTDEYYQVGNQNKIGLIAEQYIEYGASTITAISSDTSSVGIYTYRKNTTEPRTTNYIFMVLPLDGTPSGKMVYPVTEPTEYTITPTEITLAEGSNTIYSDTGDSKLTYKAGR